MRLFEDFSGSRCISSISDDFQPYFSPSTTDSDNYGNDET